MTIRHAYFPMPLEHLEEHFTSLANKLSRVPGYTAFRRTHSFGECVFIILSEVYVAHDDGYGKISSGNYRVSISSVYCRGDVVWLVGEAARDWCLDWPVCRPQDVHLDSPRNKWTSGLACEQLN